MVFPVGSCFAKWEPLNLIIRHVYHYIHTHLLVLPVTFVWTWGFFLSAHSFRSDRFLCCSLICCLILYNLLLVVTWLLAVQGFGSILCWLSLFIVILFILIFTQFLYITFSGTAVFWFLRLASDVGWLSNLWAKSSFHWCSRSPGRYIWAKSSFCWCRLSPERYLWEKSSFHWCSTSPGEISEQNQVSADAGKVQGDISEQNQVSADSVQVQVKSTLSQSELVRPLQLPAISKWGLPIKDEVIDALAALPPQLVTSSQTTPNISLNGHDQLVMGIGHVMKWI